MSSLETYIDPVANALLVISAALLGVLILPRPGFALGWSSIEGYSGREPLISSELHLHCGVVTQPNVQFSARPEDAMQMHCIAAWHASDVLVTFIGRAECDGQVGIGTIPAITQVDW